MPIRIGGSIEMPEALVNTNRGRAMHNKVAKIAAKKTMEMHHKKRVPSHFRPSNRTKYGHKRRSKSYLEIKKKLQGHTIDLVRTGDTRRKMTQSYKAIRVGGDARNHTITATLVLQFPGNVGSGKQSRNGVKVRDMRQEIEQWTDAEEKEAGREFLNFYVAEINKALAGSPRLTKQIGGTVTPLTSGIFGVFTRL